jgi:hypothetical protein
VIEKELSVISHLQKEAKMRAIRIFALKDTKLKKEYKVGRRGIESWGIFPTESDVEPEESLLF